MITISQKQQEILRIVLEGGVMQSSDVHHALLTRGVTLSLVTAKRTLSAMTKAGVLTVTGSGPATAYSVSVLGRLSITIDPAAYCAIEPDKRFGLRRYNFDLFPAIPKDLFSDHTLRVFNEATAEYKRRTADSSLALQKKELERLIIELSWKSSKIEGNTYTLLDTEQLILKNKEAAGHDKKEARMILNHKDAFTFIHEQRNQFTTLSRFNLEQVHTMIIKGLNVRSGLRRTPVGVLGSIYQPLDNVHQITDAVEALAIAVSRAKTPYAKALITLFGISYIQPFEDGNKRTSRLMANAILLAHGCAPLSYRSVDEKEYREAMLVFYELNVLKPLEKIFVAQYDFAARNYAVQ